MNAPSKPGRAFVFGDNIDTDVLAPGSLMKLSPEALATHCLEAVDPGFAGAVKAGDVLVAGANFGLGSSREQAAVSLKILGIQAVLATSFARVSWAVRSAWSMSSDCVSSSASNAACHLERISWMRCSRR